MNRATLLCVDDDLGIREFYEAFLNTFGYDVVVAEDGNSALDLFRSRQGEIDAIVSDYDMPGMTGVELASEVKQLDPAVPVIIISGSEPVVHDEPRFFDVALAKGTPIQKIADHIETLLARRAVIKSKAKGSPWLSYVPLGSALASVAVAALVLPKLSAGKPKASAS
jgi:DNA-binding NtrC family response regulator